MSLSGFPTLGSFSCDCESSNAEFNSDASFWRWAGVNRSLTGEGPVSSKAKRDMVFSSSARNSGYKRWEEI